MRVLFADQGLRLTALELASVRQRDGITLQILQIEPCALSFARNNAINMGLSASIIAFPDDDCWYAPTVLLSVQKIFDEQPALQCVCTNVFDPDKNLTYGGRPVGIRLPITFSNIFSLPISVGIFIRRDAFELVGAQFDESLGAGTFLGSGEETELISRLLASGARILYAGDISVFHPVPDYEIRDAEKFFSYGIGYGFLAVTFIKRGHYIVAVNWLNMLARSLIGSLLHLFEERKRAVYWRRFVGIVNGSKLALRQSAQQAKL